MNIRSASSSSPYAFYRREEWARLADAATMPLNEAELEHVSGLTERISGDEVADIYLPLSRLLNLHVEAVQRLHVARENLLQGSNRKMPFIIGMAGSVAVGKSTSARVLQALLARWPSHPRVALVPTDGFLLPNAVLQSRGLMTRKGFPQSYDVRRLRGFLADVKAGRDEVRAPVYSHFIYDVVEGEEIVVERPDILIVEGLNVLQPARLPRAGDDIPYVSDFFDFSIYLDADPALIEDWYVTRFLRLHETAFRDPASFFHRYAALPEAEARATAVNIWRSINLVNLRQNILPTRQRADLILRKGTDHAVDSVALRKL
jgi:type I pantothenate kinase